MMKNATKKPGARLTEARVRAPGKLARRIDAEEQDEIKLLGRTIFRRHCIAREMVDKLKARRNEMGMSLTELANRTGIAKSNLSRLENSQNASPTLDTLHRYAQAIGMKMRVELN